MQLLLYIQNNTLWEKIEKSIFKIWFIALVTLTYIFTIVCRNMPIEIPIIPKGFVAGATMIWFSPVCIFHYMHSKTRNRCSLLCAIKCDFSYLIDEINLLTLSMIAVCYCWYATLGMQVYQPKCLCPIQHVYFTRKL